MRHLWILEIRIGLYAALLVGLLYVQPVRATVATVESGRTNYREVVFGLFA